MVAVVAAAWLGLSLRNDLLTVRGIETAVGPALTSAPSDPNVRRAGERGTKQLRSAQLLNPDPTPSYYEAVVKVALGQRENAVRTLRQLALEHPDDAFVWQAIVRLAPPNDPRSAEALARLRMLKPL